MQISSFVAANWLTSSSTSFVKTNPFTGETLYSVSSCDLMGLVQAVNSANKAFAEWKLSSTEDRLQLVEKIKAYLVENKNQIARSEALDQALPLWFVTEALAESSISLIDSHLAEYKKQNSTDSGKSYMPVGVVAVVASWNLSLKTILARLVPALLAGNAVVVKVSSQSPSTALVLGQMLENIKAPAGLVNVLVSNDLDVQQTLVTHPGIKAVSVVGSLETSQSVLQNLNKLSSQNFKKLQVGSGSKNSAVALAEPTETVFNEVMNSFMLGQGQLAWNSSRLFVLEKFEVEWSEKIQNYLQSLKPSESIEDASVWTPCLKKKSFDKFEEIKAQAFEDKGKLLQSTTQLKSNLIGRYLAPVFTKDMSRCSTLQQDQIHSPFFILSAVKYPFDVPKYSNVSYFGFASHLYGEPEKFKKVADGLEVGAVFYNSFSAKATRLWSATKQSGYGLQDDRALGSFFSNIKNSY